MCEVCISEPQRGGPDRFWPLYLVFIVLMFVAVWVLTPAA